jgi:hypothetical protein
MLEAYFDQLNYLAVIVAAVVYFGIGSVWFSGLFGKTWLAEVEKHGVRIQKPTTPQMITMMISTFVYNLMTAFGVSLLVYVIGTSTVVTGLKLGLFAGICFAATSMLTAYNWESRSTKLSMIDIGYPLLGIVACAIILSVWH